MVLLVRGDLRERRSRKNKVKKRVQRTEVICIGNIEDKIYLKIIHYKCEFRSNGTHVLVYQQKKNIF